MKYGVICYATHNKNIASYDWFNDIDDAVMFLRNDADYYYNMEAEFYGYDNVNADIIGHHAIVSANNGEREWTWHIIDDSPR